MTSVKRAKALIEKIMDICEGELLSNVESALTYMLINAYIGQHPNANQDDFMKRVRESYEIYKQGE